MNTTTAFLAITVSLLAHGFSQIPYQGRLTDNTGKPLPDGSATVTFGLHNAATGGAQLWGPEVKSINLVNGRFATKLGDTAAGIGEALSLGGRYLSISVGTAPALQPRQEILPAPRALVADAANRLTGSIVLQSDEINTEQAHRIFLKEFTTHDTHGFSIAYAGLPSPTFDGQPFNFVSNSFNILRHSNSVAGTPVLTVKRDDGRMIVNGGGLGPTSSFEIAGPVESLSPTDGIGMFSVGIQSGDHVAMSRNTIQVYNNNTPADLGLNLHGGNVFTDKLFGKVLIGDAVVSKGTLEVQGDTSFAATPGISASDGSKGTFFVGSTGGRHIVMDNDDIQGFANDTPARVDINYYGGDVQIGSAGATVTVPGTFTNSSDRHLKEDFAPVDSEAVLERLVDLPLSSWRYLGSKGRRHVGPVSQDFHAAFDDLLDLNSDETTIAPLDEAGVAFASIQALHGKVEADQNEIESLKRENASLAQRLEQLEALVESMAAGS